MTSTFQIAMIGGSTGVWDDFRSPSTGINPPGAASDPDLDTDDGCFLFSATATEIIAVIAQMPHSWKEGTTIYPHVHWSKTTSASGNVLWRCEYQKANLGSAFSGSWTALDDALSTTPETPDGNTANEHLKSFFGPLSMAGNNISTIVKFKISRIGGNVSDTYGADAKMLEFDFHYQLDTPGSQSQSEK